MEAIIVIAMTATGLSLGGLLVWVAVRCDNEMRGYYRDLRETYPYRGRSDIERQAHTQLP